MSRIRLLIADDHPVVRSGINGLFAHSTEFEVVGEAENGAEAVTLVHALNPDVLLLDLRMPVLNGLGVLQTLQAEHSTTRVLILTSYDTDQDIQHALKLGAIGYLLKDVSREELYQAVRLAATGKAALSSTVSLRVLEYLRSPETQLTEREIEVLQRVALGKSNKEISRDLSISEATIKTHLKHIYAKLDVPDRASAVRLALEKGILRLNT